MATNPLSMQTGSRRMSLSKLASIGVLALATIVPTTFVGSVVGEREGRQQQIETEFAQSWGPQQVLRGPVLVVPYPNGTSLFLNIAPSRATLTASLDPHERARGLFRGRVYDAAIDIQATFEIPDEAQLRLAAGDRAPDLDWENAFLAVGMTALKGSRDEDGASIDGIRKPWLACRDVVSRDAVCLNDDLLAVRLIHGTRPASGSELSLKGTVHLRGTGSFAIRSPAKQLATSIAAPWHSPSFVGDAIPSRSTVIDGRARGDWNAIAPGRTRIWMSTMPLDVAASGPRFGLDLLPASPIYRMVDRTTKYGLLIVGLSFGMYLCFELASGIRIHLMQYGLLGLSLSLFGLLLVSFSEMVGFGPAFAASAALIIAQSSLYTAAVGGRAGLACLFSAMLTALFGFLYVLLGLETFSFLVGTLALFLVLSLVMALTERVRRAGGSFERPNVDDPAPVSTVAG